MYFVVRLMIIITLRAEMEPYIIKFTPVFGISFGTRAAREPGKEPFHESVRSICSYRIAFGVLLVALSSVDLFGELAFPESYIEADKIFHCSSAAVAPLL